MTLDSLDFWPNLLADISVADMFLQDNKLSYVQRDLQELMEATFPSSTISIKLFGSYKLGLAGKNSDLVFYIGIDKHLKKYTDSPTEEVWEQQRNIETALRSSIENWNYQSKIENGPYPIVTAIHRTAGLSCDISSRNNLAGLQNYLTLFLFQLQPIARHMVIYLRKWIEEIGLKIMFKSQVLIDLVVYFLQIENYLPSIQALQLNLEPTFGPLVTSFWKVPLSSFNMTEIKVDEAETRAMLKKFFKFYSIFDFANMAVCPYLGRTIERERLEASMPERYKSYKGFGENQFKGKTAVMQDIIELKRNNGIHFKA